MDVVICSSLGHHEKCRSVALGNVLCEVSSATCVAIDAHMLDCDCEFDGGMRFRCDVQPAVHCLNVAMHLPGAWPTGAFVA